MLKTTLARLPFIFFLVFSATHFPSTTFGQAANLDQVRNGSATSPVNPGAWVNGNAGPSNAHFAEGYSIPYRASVTGLTGNAATVHHLIIEWDSKHGNGHALDYITHYQNLDNPQGSHQATFGHVAETIDPTLGTAFAGAPSLFQIPAPSSAGSEVAGQPTTSFNNLPTAAFANFADVTKMAIWGGTIVSLTYVFQDPPDATTAQTETRLDIAFTSANASTALIAWGGHIAAEYDWGAGRGATGVSGSPYHTRIIEIDGKPGNQDRSLKADAVIIPPPLCGISPAQFACPETTQLVFDATGSSTGLGITYEWTLTNGNPSAGAMIQGSNTGFSIIVVPSGTDFIAGGTFSLSLTVHKTGAQSTTCNQSPAGTIIKTIATAAANPTEIDLTSAAHNTTLTADIDATSTFPTNTDYTYLWEVLTAGTLGQLTNANQRIATYTADMLDPSSITFKVTATLNKSGAPACVDDAQVTVTLAGAGICDVTPQGPVCVNAVTTHNGSPDPIPSTATYTWELSGFGGAGTTTSTFASANGGTSIQVNATQSYRITLNQVYDNPAANSSCFEDVIVNVVNPGVIAGDQTLCTPFDPAEFTSTTDATGTGDITYQWQISTTSCDAGFTDIPGATSATYDAPAVTQVTYFRRVATSTVNGVPCSDNSNCLTMTPNEVTPGVIAGDQTLCAPFDPAAFTSTTDATGTGDITYQWQISTTSCEAGFTDIPGATSATYDAPAVTQVTFFRRVATSTLNGVPCSDNSNCLTVTPNEVNPGVINNAQTICVGEDPSVLTDVTSATGDGSITYQWQISTTSCEAGFTDIPGANAATFDPGPLTVTTFYRRTATSTLNGVPCSENSNCVEITVKECLDHIFPTGTECNDFTGQTVPPLESLCFQQSGGLVTNASAPGAWFYYINVTKPAGATQITVRVNQSNDGVISGLFTTNEIKAWTSTCTRITANVTTNLSNPSIPEITIAGLSNAEQTIIVSVKYNSSSIVGSAVSGNSSVYTFNTSFKTTGAFALVPGSEETITAQDCSNNITNARGSDILTNPVIVAPTKLKVSAYPNPYHGSTINFSFVAPVSGKASLEVYDLLGRRLALVFEGNVDAGIQKIVDYKVPSTHRVAMIYKLSIGNKTGYGRLLPGTE